jgi:hypothetical protein
MSGEPDSTSRAWVAAAGMTSERPATISAEFGSRANTWMMIKPRPVHVSRMSRTRGHAVWSHFNAVLSSNV